MMSEPQLFHLTDEQIDLELREAKRDFPKEADAVIIAKVAGIRRKSAKQLDEVADKKEKDAAKVPEPAEKKSLIDSAGGSRQHAEIERGNAKRIQQRTTIG